MAVTIKSQREIDLMRKSCRLLAKVHEELGQAIELVISTLFIDQLGEKLIRIWDVCLTFCTIMAIRHPSVCR